MEALLEHSSLIQLVNRVRHTRRKGQRTCQAEHAATPSAVSGAADATPGAGEELGLRDQVQLPPTTPEWKEAWRVTEAVLTLMRDDCRSMHTPFEL